MMVHILSVIFPVVFILSIRNETQLSSSPTPSSNFIGVQNICYVSNIIGQIHFVFDQPIFLHCLFSLLLTEVIWEAESYDAPSCIKLLDFIYIHRSSFSLNQLLSCGMIFGKRNSIY